MLVSAPVSSAMLRLAAASAGVASAVMPIAVAANVRNRACARRNAVMVLLR